MSYDDHTKSWRIIAFDGLPKVSKSNLDSKLHPWINPLCSGFQDTLSMFNSKLFMKLWSIHLRTLNICIEDDKFHLSTLRACVVLKLSRYMRDSVDALTNHVLATSELGFKMSSEHEK